jgi:hypothetical protein
VDCISCFDSGDCNSHIAKTKEHEFYHSLIYWARKLNSAERGNTYSAHDLKTLAVCEAVKQWRCYLEGRSKFFVGTDYNKLRHLLMQPNKKLNDRDACYLRDLQPLVGTMTLAYRKGVMKEADPLSRRPYFVTQATFLWF